MPAIARPVFPLCAASIALLLVGSILAAGCGGGGGKDIGPTITTQIVATMDGQITQNVGVVPPTGDFFNIGDTDTNDAMRVFLAFPITDLAGKTIVSATLSYGQVTDIAWGAPFTSLGDLLADRIDLGFDVDLADWSSAASWTGTLTNLTGTGIRSADVKPALEGALGEGRSRLDLRLHFAALTDGDGTRDSISIDDIVDPTIVLRPTLTVVHTP